MFISSVSSLPLLMLVGRVLKGEKTNKMNADLRGVHYIEAENPYYVPPARQRTRKVGAIRQFESKVLTPGTRVRMKDANVRLEG